MWVHITTYLTMIHYMEKGSNHLTVPHVELGFSTPDTFFSIHAFFKIVPSGNHNTAVQPSLCPFSFILCFAGQFVCIQWTATEHIMNQDNPSNRALFGLHLRSGELSRLLKQRGLFEEMNWTEPPECRKQKVTFKNFLCKSKTREYKQNWQQFNEVQQNWSNLVHTRVCSCN